MASNFFFFFCLVQNARIYMAWAFCLDIGWWGQGEYIHTHTHTHNNSRAYFFPVYITICLCIKLFWSIYVFIFFSLTLCLLFALSFLPRLKEIFSHSFIFMKNRSRFHHFHLFSCVYVWSVEAYLHSVIQFYSMWIFIDPIQYINIKLAQLKLSTTTATTNNMLRQYSKKKSTIATSTHNSIRSKKKVFVGVWGKNRMNDRIVVKKKHKMNQLYMFQRILEP